MAKIREGPFNTKQEMMERIIEVVKDHGIDYDKIIEALQVQKTHDQIRKKLVTIIDKMYLNPQFCDDDFLIRIFDTATLLKSGVKLCREEKIRRKEELSLRKQSLIERRESLSIQKIEFQSKKNERQ